MPDVLRGVWIFNPTPSCFEGEVVWMLIHLNLGSASASIWTYPCILGVGIDIDTEGPSESLLETASTSPASFERFASLCASQMLLSFTTSSSERSTSPRFCLQHLSRSLSMVPLPSPCPQPAVPFHQLTLLLPLSLLLLITSCPAFVLILERYPCLRFCTRRLGEYVSMRRR